MKNLINVLKGMIIGVANIIPGVSGGTLMIILGVYEEIIETISHFFSNFKKNILYLLPFGIGMIISILILSKVISFSLEKYPFATTIFFIGLIIGGIPLLWEKASASKNKISNWIVFLITFSIVLLFTFMKSDSNMISLNNLEFFDYVKLFFVGIISAGTMVIPGISGSFVLMLLGYYESIVNVIKNLTDFANLGKNLLILIPFGIGILVGIILVAKLLEYLFNKYPVKTNYGVLGFVISSIIAIVISILHVHVNLLEVIISIILFIVGGIIAYKLGEK